MRHFVADRSAGLAVINRIIHLLVEIRRLQNAGWKIDGVQLWIVVSVDGGRGHSPLLAIYWLTDLCQLPLQLEITASICISHCVTADSLQAGIIAPVIRVSDFVLDFVQL